MIASRTLALTALLALGTTAAQAAPCANTDVKITSLSVAGVPGSTTPVSVSATECLGAYAGTAIPLPGTAGGKNLGYYQDGLFNGAGQGGKGGGAALFPNGIFADQYTATDLNGDGKKDPGWIYLGSWTPGAGNGFKAALINGQAIIGNNWFSATMNTAGNGGTWSFVPPSNVVSLLEPIFGSNLFDQFALSFMSGSTFAAYDFTAAGLGLPVSSSTIYNFGGSWDMSRTLINGGGKAGALSHIDLYVRDPIGPRRDVPEPGTLSLLLAALAGAALYRRRQG